MMKVTSYRKMALEESKIVGQCLFDGITFESPRLVYC